MLATEIVSPAPAPTTGEAPKRRASRAKKAVSKKEAAPAKKEVAPKKKAASSNKAAPKKKAATAAANKDEQQVNEQQQA